MNILSKNKSDWIVGTWKTESSVILKINKRGRKFQVYAFDKDDNEKIVVSNVVWNRKYLRFETFIPSTGYKTKNILHITSRTTLRQELTIFEDWEKI